MGAFRGTVATNMVLGLLGLVTGTLSARLLGPDGRGDLALIQLWPTVFAIVAMLGLPEALVYFGARERERLGEYLGSAVVLATLSSVAFVALGWMTLPLVLASHGADLVLAAQRYLLIIPLFALTLLPTHPLRGLGEFGWWNVMRLGPAFAWLVILLIAFGLDLDNARALATFHLAGLAGVGVVATIVVQSRVQPPYRVSRSPLKGLLTYGLPAFGATLPQLLNLRLDQLVMTAVLSSRDVGFYVVAVAWSTASMPILIALGQVVFPRIASEHDTSVQAVAFASASRNAVGLMALSIVALGFATPAVLPFLLTSRFQPAVRPALILTAAGGVYGYSYVLAEGIRGLGRPMVTLWAQLAGLLATGMFLALLLPRLGLMGAAIASLGGYTAVMVWYLVFLRRARLIVTWAEWLLPQKKELWKHIGQFVRTSA